MTTQIVKVILAGILAGIALFLMPFILIRIVVFFLLISMIIRLIRPRGWRRRYEFCHHTEYAQRWNSMTMEERNAFKEKMRNEFFAPSHPPSSTNL